MSATQTIGWSCSKTSWKQWKNSHWLQKGPAWMAKWNVTENAVHLSLFPLWNRVPPFLHMLVNSPVQPPFFFPPYLLPLCFEKRVVSPGYFSVLQLSCDWHLLPQSKAQSTPLFQELAGQPWSRKQQATKLHNDKGVLLALHTNHFTCFTCIEIFCLLLSWRAALLLGRQLTCS